MYESFKDQNQHQTIINLCEENDSAGILVKRALRCILEKNGDFSVEDGLSELSSLSPAPGWNVLSNAARQNLGTISRTFPELVKKSASSIATTSTSATIPTSNTGQFHGVSVEDVAPAAFRVVVGAAYKKAIERGLEKDGIDAQFKKLFWTDSVYYRAAYKAVVEEKGLQSQQTTMTQKLRDIMEKAIQFLDGIDLAAQNRADSTEQSNFDHLYQAAMHAFSLFVEKDFSFTKEQIGALMHLVLQPTKPN